MALDRITEQEMDEQGVCAAPDILNGTPAENKAVFDRMMRQLAAPLLNTCAEEIEKIQTQETQMADAETERKKAEASRVEAEENREEAEIARDQAEQAREEAEQNRQAISREVITEATNQAALAESWATGGTGTREGEDVDNARYWSQQAQYTAGGGVTSFNNRSGVVTPKTGDYTAEMVGARPDTWTPTAKDTNAIPAEEKGAAGGVASLGEDGKVPEAHLPEMGITFQESADYPGCYYREADGVVEWLNPPLEMDTEYRTIKRYNNRPVYVQIRNCGLVPSSTSSSVPINASNVLYVVSVSAQIYQSDGTKGTLPLSNTSGTVTVWANSTNIYLQSNNDVYASCYVLARIEYTKETD